MNLEWLSAKKLHSQVEVVIVLMGPIWIRESTQQWCNSTIKLNDPAIPSNSALVSELFLICLVLALNWTAGCGSAGSSSSSSSSGGGGGSGDD